MHEYLPIVVQIVIALGIAFGILVVTHLFGQRASTTVTKDSPYECGMLMEGKSHPRFAVKFYVTAMLFILFDVEVVFLLPWVLVYRDMLSLALPVLYPVLFFLMVLTVGLIYELKTGALDWEK